MDSKELEKLKYPIGRFSIPDKISEEDIKRYIIDIEELPDKLRNLISNLSDEKLNTPYRPNGWTVKQLIHHIADSHMNSYLRFKLALTEDTPTIKPYYEDKWAELADYKNTSADISLTLIESLHKRWVNLLNSMNEKDFEKSFFHPEQGKEYSLDELTALYSWHSKHHYAHIEELKKRKSW